MPHCVLKETTKSAHDELKTKKHTETRRSGITAQIFIIEYHVFLQSTLYKALMENCILAESGFVLKNDGDSDDYDDAINSE